MKSQSNEYPAMIQRLDNKSYAFNDNKQEKSNEDGVDYEFDQVIVNEANVNSNSILRQVLVDNWDVNQQLKLANDYFAYQLGILSDEKYKTRYEDFLSFRATIKSEIDKTVI